MAIEITTGGITKTYRYYPYDALYVDASGNVNASGDGQQVREAWFNGVKYYPDGDAGVWGGKITALSGKNDTNYVYTTATTSYNYYSKRVGILGMSLAWCLVFDIDDCYVQEDRRRPSIGRFNSYLYLRGGYDASKRINAHLELVANIHAAFSEDATGALSDYNVFNRNRFTNYSQSLFDAFASGLVVKSSSDVVLANARNIEIPTDIYGVKAILPYSGSFARYEMPQIALTFEDPTGPWEYTLRLMQSHAWNGWSQYSVDCGHISGTNDGSSYPDLESLEYRSSASNWFSVARGHLSSDGTMDNGNVCLKYQKFESSNGLVSESDLLPLPS